MHSICERLRRAGAPALQENALKRSQCFQFTADIRADTTSPPYQPSDFYEYWQILVNWVVFQVSIAVLLDNFLSASENLKQEEHRRHIQERQLEKHFQNPLDPLILRLSKDYINEEDLSSRLKELFKVFRKNFLFCLSKCSRSSMTIENWRESIFLGVSC